MRNIFITVLFILLITGCSQKVYVGARWQKSEIKIDGKTDDWEIPLKNYDKKAQLNYEVSNDNENLYFAARSTDESTIQNILMGGLKLEIDTLAKSNNYPFSLKFPLMGRPMGDREALPERDGMDNSQQGRNNSARPQSFEKDEPSKSPMPMEKHENIQLLGFNNFDEETTILISDVPDIKVKCEKDSLDILFYEIAIPFKSFFKERITPSDTLDVFSFRVTLENILMPGMGKPQAMEQNGGRPEMGGGRPPMGGGGAPPMGGGPGGGGSSMGGPPSGDMNQNSNEDKIEIKFELHLSYF